MTWANISLYITTYGPGFRQNNIKQPLNLYLPLFKYIAKFMYYFYHPENNIIRVIKILLLALYFVAIIYIFELIIILSIKVLYNIKIRNILDSIETKEDLLYLSQRDLEHVISLMFRRMGYSSVRFSNSFGEGSPGIILDDKYYVQITKTNFKSKINVEMAAKLAWHMLRDSIYRGIYITLGDFEKSTLNFCHKNVIQCINGDRLLEMCKDARNVSGMSKRYSHSKT